MKKTFSTCAGVDRGLVELSLSLGRARRWSERAHWCGDFAMWTIKLWGAIVVLGCILASGGAERFAISMLNLTAPMIWLSSVLMGAMLFVGIPATLWQRRCFDRITEIALRKQYPPGCTCIVGTLTDNPSCPHHREGA